LSKPGQPRILFYFSKSNAKNAKLSRRKDIKILLKKILLEKIKQQKNLITIFEQNFDSVT